MKEKYYIDVPEDFSHIISDLLQWHQKQPDSSLIIALEGDLGAGKTTFTQQLAKTLGVTKTVNSPTFTIMKQYELERSDYQKLIHIDAYRIESETELEPLRILDLVTEENIITCLEWPEKVPSLVIDQVVRLNIKIEEGDRRIVTIKLPSEQ